MKYTLDKSCLESFSSRKAVELSFFYNPLECIEINREIDQILEQRGITRLSSKDEIMFKGRDLFRDSETFSKVVKMAKLGSLAYELTWQKPLRLGFDQILVGGSNTPDQTKPSPFFLPDFSLLTSSSISEPLLGICIGLNIKEKKESPFPSALGNVTLFSPSLSFSLGPLELGERFLLLVFSTRFSQYLYQEKDPQNHYLKKLGYVYGDKLQDHLHPIIFR